MKIRDILTEQGVAEGTELSVPQLATISDEALDKAYGYGRSTPGNTFGWQANLMSAAYAKKLIDAGVTDIEKISDAIHKGWNVTAQKFVQNPDQFDDTEKLRQAGKLDAKLQQRAKLMKINYAQLDNDEQEKDRVVARALLQAIKGPQALAERSDEYQGEIDTSNLVLKSLMYKSGGSFSDGYYDGKVYDNQGQYIGDLGFIPGGTLGQTDGYTGSYSWPHRVTLYVKNPKDPQLQSYWEKMGKDKFGYGKFPLEYKISNLNDPLAKQAIDLYTKANLGKQRSR